MGGRHLYLAQHVDAVLRQLQGDFTGAEKLYLANLEAARAIGRTQGIVQGHINLAFLAAQRSDTSGLRGELHAYIDTEFAGYDASGKILDTLALCAALASLVGEPELTARFHGVAEAHSARVAFRHAPADVIAIRAHIDRARSGLGEKRFDALAAAASTENPNGVIEFARGWLKALSV